MIFRLSLLCVALASASIAVSADIAVNSKAGQRLLSNARRVEANNDEEDFSWIASYSIKYVGCQSIVEFGGEGGGGGREREEYTGSKVFNRQLVRFRLCPTDTCSKSCGGGAEYLTDMGQFVEAYYEAKMEAQEYACNQVEENCDCEDANDDDQCLQECYAYAGLEDCLDQEADDDNARNQNDFEIREALECSAIDDNDDGYASYFLGATCSRGRNINLAVFSDGACTKKADPSIFAKYNGFELPYTQDSVVKYDCISCADQQNNGNNNNGNNNNGNDADANAYYYAEPNEMCERLYEEAAKCEKKVVGKTGELYKADCKFIHSTVYKLAHPGRNVFAWILVTVFAACTVGLAYYVYQMREKLQRNNISLNA